MAVFVLLTDQPQRAIFASYEQFAKVAIDSAESGLRRLSAQASPDPNALRTARELLDRLVVEMRRAALSEIGRAVFEPQSSVETLLRQAGGARIGKYGSVNMLTAEMRVADLAIVESHPLVDEILPAPRVRTRLATSTGVFGAPSFWANGLTGGGQAVGILDSGNKVNHPAFAGKDQVNRVFLSFGSLDPCFADTSASVEDRNGHGTHVSGIVASQGSADWTAHKGVAPGLGSLYNLKVAYVLGGAGCSSGALADLRDVYAALDWALRETSVRIFNFSYGDDTTSDDDAFSRVIDSLVDTYGVILTIAGGNGGAGCKVGSPAIAYNGVSVGNFASRGTMNSSSCIGPTVGGRFKPDIAAPGTGIVSTGYNWDSAGTPDFFALTGTSMAAPHVAGAAALLRQAGVTDPLSLRAVLFNSADGEGWAANRGWGFGNLDTAKTQSAFHAAGSLASRVQPGSFHLFELAGTGRIKATTVWNRHVPTGSSPALNDIDLYIYNRDTGAELGSSTESNQNVEQVTAQGPVVVKVKMWSDTLRGGVTQEKYGAAFSSAAVFRAGPVLAPVCSVPSTIAQGSTFNLTCRVTNTGDLTASNVTLSATLPSGLSGNPNLSWSSAAKGGSTTDQTAPLTASNSSGAYTVVVRVSAGAFGESFSGQANVPVTVGASAPEAPVNPSPAHGETGVPVAPALSWSPAAGASSYDVYLGTAANPPLVGNTATTSFAAGTLAANTVYFWRVVAKNTTGPTSSATWSFTTTSAGPAAPANPSPADAATAVAVAPTLTWTAAAGATSYDVYFGLAPAPPLLTNTTGTTVAPAALSPGTKYFWRVEAKTGSSGTSSPTWSFTTAPAPGAPLNPSPAIAATGVATPVTLGWSASANASSYDVFFGTTSDPAFLVNTASPSAAAPALVAGPQYFWRVVARNAAGNANSATWNFTTAASPGAPLNPSPAIAATGVVAPVTLGWSASANATSYDVYFGTTSDPAFLVNSASPSAAAPALSAGTQYFWRVVAKNGAGNANSATWNFTTAAAPGAPANPSPANGATGVALTATLGWAAVPNAASYDVYFGTNEANPPLLRNTASPAAAPGALTAGVQYFWRVVAKGPGGSTGSAVWTFTALPPTPPPGAPSNPSPVSGASAVGSPAALSWTAGANAAAHDVYLGTVNPPPFASTVAGSTYTTGQLPPNTVYFWQVVSKNATGNTPSPVWVFVSGNPGEGPAVVSVGLSNPTGLAVDDSFVYWADSGSNSIRRTSKSGGAQAGIYAGAVTSGLAVDGASVYFSDGARVLSVPKGGGAGTQLAAAAANRLALDDGFVYWTNPAAGLVQRVGKGGGAPTTLASGLRSPLGIRIKDGFVYWTEAGAGGGVWRVPSSGGTPSKYADGSQSAGIEVFGAGVYWADNSAASGRIRSLTDGFESIPASGLGTPLVDTAADGEFLYWLEGSTNGLLRQMRPGGGTLAALAQGLSDPVAILADAGFVYWLERAGGAPGAGMVKRIARSASLPEGPSAPTPGSPANEASGVSRNPALTYAAGARSESHDIYFGTASPPPLALNQPVSSGTGTYSPQNLAADALYYWRVVAKGPGGSASSPVRSFRTVPAAPAAPSLVSPADGASGVAAPLDLVWSASAGAAEFDVFFGTANPPPKLSTVPGTSAPVAQLTPGSTYYWRVQAKNAGGGADSPVRSFTALEAPGAPLNPSPADGAGGVTGLAALSWTASPRASSYDVFFGTTADPPLAGNVTSPAFNAGAVAAGVRYFWRVVARNAAGLANSSTWSFTAQAGPGAPGSPNPADGATAVGAIGALTWSAVTGSTYDVYFGTAADPPLGGSAASASYAPGPLAAGTKYYWRVIAKNAAGTATSPVWSFTTAATAGGPPTAPSIAAPSAGQIIVVPGVTLQWEAPAGATGYELRVRETASSRVVFTGTLAGAASTRSLLELPDGVFTLAVRACAGAYSDAACSSYSEREFRVAADSPGGAPSVTQPTSGAALTASTNTLAWTSVAGAVSYEVHLLDAANNRSELRIRTPALSTIFSLRSSTRYELRVRACSAACGPWSAASVFSAAIPPAPSASPAVTASVGAGGILTVSWNSVPGADLYDVQVVQSAPAGPGGGALTVAARRTSATSVNLPVPPGRASVFVAACNGNGCGPLSTAIDIDPQAPPPAAPEIGSPLAGSAVNGPVVLFTWSRVPGDTGSTVYRLFVQDLSRQSAAADVLTTQNYWAISLNAEGAQYGAQVIANPGSSQAAGPAVSFNVRGSNPTAPSLVSPRHNDRVPQGNVRIGWTPLPGAGLYQYFVARAGETSPQAAGVTTGLLVEAPLSAAGSAASRHSAIVRACPAGASCAAGSDAGWGPWSNAAGTGVSSFDVAP